VKRLAGLLSVIALVVLLVWICWTFQPWTPTGRAVHLSSVHLRGYDFQVWQQRNTIVTEPFSTRLFARKSGGKWLVFLLDFQDTGDFGGRDRDRTGDLLVANEALSQLSYSPTSSSKSLTKDIDVSKTPRESRFGRFTFVWAKTTVGRWPRRCAGPQSSARSGKAPALAAWIPRPFAPADRLPAEL
jgi:hypothetical protein